MSCILLAGTKSNELSCVYRVPTGVVYPNAQADDRENVDTRNISRGTLLHASSLFGHVPGPKNKDDLSRKKESNGTGP